MMTFLIGVIILLTPLWLHTYLLHKATWKSPRHEDYEPDGLIGIQYSEGWTDWRGIYS